MRTIPRLMPRPSSPSHRYAFTLTEMGIVLGIVGVVLGGVWYAAQGVWQSQKIGQASDEVAQIANNIRDAYTGRTTSVALTDVTSKLVTQNAFPLETLVNSTPMNPWHGTINVSFLNSNEFYIVLAGLDAKTCIGLLSIVKGTGTRTTTLSSGPIPSTAAVLQPTNKTQEGTPTNTHYRSGTTWTDVTGMDAEDLVSTIGTSCNAVSFFYVI